MSRTTTSAATYPTINTVGALLPSDLLTRLAGGDLEHLAASTYGLPDGFTLRQAAARAWELLLPTYRSFQTRLAALPENDPATVVTRDRWTTVVLRELGYDLAAIANIQIEDDTFDVRHIDGHVPAHMLGWNVDLDKRAATNIRGASRTAPHSLIQELLNRTDKHLWAVLTNGKRLRLLRDNIVMGRPAYIEFDLEGMFTGEQFADFAIMYALIHASRLRSEEPPACILEQWRTVAINDGTRALENLRDGVVQALKTLGGGFLEHPDNRELRDLLAANPGATDDYYRWLLRLVYRLIFLFVAEDRDLLHTDATPSLTRQRYADHFSTARLREDANRRRSGRHSDKWQTLKMVFGALGSDGEPALGLPAYGSALFDPSSLEALNRSQISNENLLRAIGYLSLLRDSNTGTLRPVDYKNLGSEELGSVYEALLEYVPNVRDDRTTFTLTVKAGNARKTTGSYYTPTGLVEVVLDQSLDPLLDEAVAKADAAAAILAITVCDPACGSGHFLVAAARRIARRLAIVRSGDPEPTVESLRDAMRDVVAHCIYGVDINDLAAELAKISLWLEALTPGRPLAFLDAHIKVGNGLIGATPALLAKNIPDIAFSPIKGDDKIFASTVKKHNKRERERIAPDQGDFWEGQDLHEVFVTNRHFGQALFEIETAGPATDIETLRKQADAWRRADADPDLHRARVVADAWCAAFVWPLDNRASDYVEPITHRTLLTLQNSPELVPLRQRRDALGVLARRYRFFHWHLEFPQIFRTSAVATSGAGWEGGFSCVISNPPWERVKLQEREWFEAVGSQLSALKNAHERKAAIDAARESGDPTVTRFDEDQERAMRTVKFVSASGRYPLTGQGDINLYSIFAETSYNLVDKAGRTGLITPSGLYTDVTTAPYSSALLKDKRLVTVLDFSNEKRIFSGVQPNVRFSIGVTAGSSHDDPVSMASLLKSPDEARLADRRYSVTADHLQSLSPLTGVLPAFSSSRDAELVLALHEQGGAWDGGLPIKQMFHMSATSGLFVTAEEREDVSADLSPLYEGKLIAQYNHRAGTFEGVPSSRRFGVHAATRSPSVTELSTPEFEVVPRYWVPTREVTKRRGSDWLVGVANVISASADIRSLRAALIPPGAGAGDTIVSIEATDAEHALWLLAQLNTLALDYALRQKVTGSHVNLSVLRQLPLLAHASDASEPALARVMVSTARQLSINSDDWKDLGESPDPYASGERSSKTALIDAAYFHLRGLDRPSVVDVCNHFWRLARVEEREFGEFRTRRLTLEAYDALK